MGYISREKNDSKETKAFKCSPLGFERIRGIRGCRLSDDISICENVYYLLHSPGANSVVPRSSKRRARGLSYRPVQMIR
jgi:hypothetical protein